MKQSIKILKSKLDKKHRELLRHEGKKKELTEGLSSGSVSRSEKIKLENDLMIVKMNIRSLSVEMDELSETIFGDWKPKGKT